MTKIFNKLVRDRIPEIITSNSKVPVIHVASDDEYFCSLKDKLLEEANEVFYSVSKKDIAEELADVLEVVFSISDFLSISREELESIRKKKAIERGSFNSRIFLEKVED